MFACLQGARAPFRFTMGTAAVCGALAMSACGGGGGGDDKDPAADKYVGTWLGECSEIGFVSSYRDRVVVTKSSDNVVRSTTYIRDYANSKTCSGSYIDSEFFTLDMTVIGTKTVDGKTVDKIDIRDAGGRTSKNIFYVSGNGLFIGDVSSVARDSEGYPTALETKVTRFRI
jgi:hypothetical protein